MVTARCRFETQKRMAMSASGQSKPATAASICRTRATQAGIDLVNSLDAPLDGLLEKQLGHMSKEELRTLVGLLEKARSPGRHPE